MKLRDLEMGQLAVILTGEFKHEIFYRNVSGIHSLTKDRYWPSEYAQRHGGGSLSHYEGPLSEEIEPIDKDRLKHLSPTIPVVEVIEVGDRSEYTVFDYLRTGSSVAKLLLALERMKIWEQNDNAFFSVAEAQQEAEYRAEKARSCILHYAMHIHTQGRMPGKSLTVRDFIRSSEDSE